MKILFCQTQFKMGGQQKVLLTIAKALNKTHDVTIYYENHNVFDFENLKIIRLSKIYQVINLFRSIIICLFKGKVDRKILADTYHLLNVKKSLKGKNFDLIILLNPYVMFVDEIRQVVKTKKIVCWTHSLYENYMYNRFKSEQKELIKSMSHADQIVSLEEYTACKWREINPNTVVIHNPIAIANKDMVTDLESKKIGYVGRIDVDVKGLDFLCQIAGLLDKNLKIYVAGEGSAKEEKEFSDLIKKNEVSNQIIRVGLLRGKKLEEFYQSLSLFIMTSRLEGFPLVAGEAMSFGVPFIGFDIPSTREVTDNGKFGVLVKQENVNEFANQIYQLLEDKSLLEKYSQKSLERAKNLQLGDILEQWEDKVFSNL
ncbi:glycosyltransferase family 4 protein [Lactovum odontotermitis]